MNKKMKHCLFFSHTKIPQEMGRSMIEMLGVLAIVGILSISAFVGYSYAINKHRANTILEDVKQLAVLGIAQDFLGRQSTGATLASDQLGAEPSKMASYTLTKESDNVFFITGSKISDPVCQMLITESPAFVEQIIPNALGSRACDADNNEIDFYINADMNGTLTPDRVNRCDDTHLCGECGDCVSGFCVDNDDKCPSGSYCVNETCGCKRGQFKDTDGSCQSCNDAASIKTSIGECQKCTNRVFSSQNQCVLCPAGSSPNSDNSKCVCPNGQFWHNGGFGDESLCQICSNTTFTTAPIEECNKCPEQFSTLKNGCYGCLRDNNASIFATTLSQCNRCSNRYFDASSSTCKLCPEGQEKNEAGTGCE